MEFKREINIGKNKTFFILANGIFFKFYHNKSVTYHGNPFLKRDA